MPHPSQVRFLTYRIRCPTTSYLEVQSASGTTTKAIRLFLIAFVVFDRLWLEGRSVTMVLRLGEVAVDLVDKGVGVGHAGEGGGVGRAVVDEVGEGFYFGYESV